MQLSELVHDLNPSWRSASLRSRANLLPRREMHGRLLEHLSRNARRAAVLVGPRQVGKTTLLRQLGDALLDGGVPAANITYFDFSDDRLPEAGISPRDVIAVRPEGFQADAPRFFLFDEVSRATRWADWLKHAVDAGEGRIVVTDSAAALLRQSGRESGQGRWDEFHLETLSLREFVALQALPREAFETTLQRLGRPLDRYLSVGGYPEHITANSLAEARRRIRADTVERAILRDLLRMDVDVERVRELFVYLLEDSGAIFDAGARQRLLDRPGAAAVDRRTLDKWITLLEESLLIVRLDPFALAATGKLKARAYPKLYAADPGLVVAFSSVADPLEDGKTYGMALEAAVFRNLRFAIAGSERSLAYLRDAKGSYEVDFLVQENGRATVLIELTKDRDPRKKLATITDALQKTKARRAIVVHGGLEEKRSGDVWLAPAERFLLAPAEWIGGK